MEYRITSPCRGSKTFDAIPKHDVELSPTKMESILRKNGFRPDVKSEVMVIGSNEHGVEVALYRRGRIIIKNVDDKDVANKIAKGIFDLI